MQFTKVVKNCLLFYNFYFFFVQQNNLFLMSLWRLYNSEVFHHHSMIEVPVCANISFSFFLECT